MKIKFSKHDPRAGSIVEMGADLAQTMIDNGQATLVGDDHEEKAISAAPQNKAMSEAPSNRAITSASIKAPVKVTPVKVAKTVKKGRK